MTQLLLTLAQEIDLSKWASTIVSLVAGIAIFAGMRVQLQTIEKRLDKIDSHIDQRDKQHADLYVRIVSVETRLDERTARPNGNTGRHPAMTE